MKFRLVLLVLFSLLVSPLYAASFDCKKPSLFSSDYEQSKEGLNFYLSDWFQYEDCMLANIEKAKNFSEFRGYLKEFFECAPDFMRAFNSWDVGLISERRLYVVANACNKRNLLKLDKLLNALWSHIKELNDGTIPESLLLEQRAWLKYYNISCQTYGDHPREQNLASSCKEREYKFRILTLSAHIQQDGEPISTVYGFERMLDCNLVRCN